MRLRSSALLGVALAGLLAAPAVTLHHVLLNDMTSVVRALVLLAWTTLLYGAAAVPLAWAAELWVTWRHRRASSTPAPEQTGPIDPHWIFCVVFPFLALISTYGVTYQQTIGPDPSTWVGMAAYFLALLLVLAGALAVLARLLARLAHALQREGRLGHITAVLATLWVLVLTVNVLLQQPVEADRTDQRPSDVRPRPTDLDVVLIGLDGLDPIIVERLIAAGEMPHLARLRERGVWGELETLPDANSAVIWATIYTGLSPELHGIHDFYRVSLPGVGRFFPAHRTAFKELLGGLERFGLSSKTVISRPDLLTVPLWEIADFFDVSNGTLDGYLYSYPAYRPANEESWFVSYGTDTWVNSVEESQGGVPAEELRLYVQPPDLLAVDDLPRKVDFEWQWQLAEHLLGPSPDDDQRPKPRFINLYAHQPDALQHEAWPELEPERFAPWQRRPASEQSIVEMHREFDRFFARIDRLADPRSVFLLVSDHGHAATITHRLYSQHRHGPPGVFLAWGGPIRRGETIEGASVYDIAPTVLRLLGLPVTEEMPGRALTEILQGQISNEIVGLRIPSYSGLWTPRIQKIEFDADRNEEQIETLRTNGYL